ncbi:hypothetical protein MTR_3g035630 [Medicago truncatula]|uniref:Uncharacterized protein n=2 Tax=Medicago truncatula TaxID=3880 RepID=G7J0Z8_MEDTR|nr:hypothetical protein MTR_3g035630 [Medicago truncatula]
MWVLRFYGRSATPGCRRRPWGDLVVPTGWRRGGRASLILFPRISDEETLGEPPTPTTVHVRSILDLTNQSFSGMFRSSFPLLRKSEPPVQVQDTIITAWTIRHPTRNRNDPIARAELYQLSYIPPEPSWSMHEGVKSVFYSFPWRSWAILDLNQRPRP